jgi:hypothetical protein
MASPDIERKIFKKMAQDHGFPTSASSDASLSNDRRTQGGKENSTPLPFIFGELAQNGSLGRSKGGGVQNFAWTSRVSF